MAQPKKEMRKQQIADTQERKKNKNVLKEKDGFKKKKKETIWGC